MTESIGSARHPVQERSSRSRRRERFWRNVRREHRIGATVRMVGKGRRCSGGAVRCRSRLSYNCFDSMVAVVSARSWGVHVDVCPTAESGVMKLHVVLRRDEKHVDVRR